MTKLHARAAQLRITTGMTKNQRNEFMKLHAFKLPLGTFHLYGEHSPHLDFFTALLSNPQNWQELQGSTRGTWVAGLDDNPIVVMKKERDPKDDYFRAGRYAPIMPEDGNLSKREVMIGRALKLSEYAMDDFAVKFETPIGYFIDESDQRFSIFEFIPDMQLLGEIVKQVGPTTRINLILGEIETVFGETIRQNIETFSEAWVRFNLPVDFAAVVMAYNGLDHNEDSSKQAVSIDYDQQVTTAHVIDFEFCRILTSVEIRNELSSLFDQFFTSLPKKQYINLDLFEELLASKHRMEERIKQYLRIERLIDVEKLDRFGPAYYLLNELNI